MNFLACEGLIDVSGSTPSCSTGWVASESSIDFSPVSLLTETLVDLFTFDPVIFGLVLFGCATIFVSGWGAGVAMRLMSRF